MQSSSRAWQRWAAVLVLLFLATRFVGRHHTLIDDETWHLLYAERPVAEQMRVFQNDMVHPPLMYLMGGAWMSVFGFTDASAKALVTVLGCVSLVAFTALAPLVVVRWRLASFLFSAAFLEIGGVATLVRGYSLALPLTALALYFWERWRRSNDARFLWLWTGVMLLLAYTHFVGPMLLAPFLLANWWYGHRRWLFTAVAVGIGVSFLPWVAYVMPTYLSRGFETNLAFLDDNVLKVTAKLPFHALSYLPSGWNVLGMNDWPRSDTIRQGLVVVALGLHAALVVVAWKRLRAYWPPAGATGTADPWVWSSAMHVVIPIAVLFAFSVAVFQVLAPRYVVFVLPAYWIAVMKVAEHGGRNGRLLVNAVVVPWVLVGIAMPIMRVYTEPSLHQSMVDVGAAFQPGDMIAADGLVGREVYLEWTRALLRRDPARILSPDRSFLDTPDLPLQPMDQVDFSGTNRVWFFATALNRSQVEAIRQNLELMGFTKQPFPGGPERPFVTLYAR